MKNINSELNSKSKSNIEDDLLTLKNGILNENNNCNGLEILDKKMFSVEDIMSNNINKMETFLNKQVINIYSRPWNKLEKKLKIKKIKEYLEENPTIELETTIILSYLKMNNKKLKVEYDNTKCQIISITY